MQPSGYRALRPVKTGVPDCDFLVQAFDKAVFQCSGLGI